MIHLEDKSLTLPDGRTLAYADNGNTSSSSLVLFLHGAFSVGYAAHLPPALARRHVHFIAPSLPGWGKSSPIPVSSTNYAPTLASDITHLIVHLHPEVCPHPSKLRLYLCGHSFGTVPAQMLHELPPHIFPLGQHIVALVLLAPLSPPHRHVGYAHSLSWVNYLIVGPPARYLPFNIAIHLARLYMARQLISETAARAYVQKNILSCINEDEDERELFARWQEEHGLVEGQAEREIAQVLCRSVAHTWRGFLDIPLIYHHGWGPSRPEKVENLCPVLVVSSHGDSLSSEDMALWLSDAYESAQLKNIDGNHFSIFLHLDDIWEEIFKSEQR